MSTLKLNVLSNLAGAGWLAVVQILLVPVYLNLLGIEGYALIGFFVTLQGALKILELGLTPTVNRELARYSVRPDLAGEARDFARTFEYLAWLVAALVAAVVWFAAPAIAFRWLQADAIPVETLLRAIRCMGLLAALQWPLSFYQGGLLGLQRQALLNVVKGIMVTLMGVVAVVALSTIAATVTVFFLSQVAVAIVHVAIMRTMLWRSLPGSSAPVHFAPGRFLVAYRFAAGMTGITICSLVVSQADKIVLSKMLSLETFGYYSIATVVGTGLAAMNAPVFNAMFPRLTALIEAGSVNAVAPLFRLASQWVAVATIPAALVIASFSFEILSAWTGDPAIARNAAPLLTVLILGSALNSLMNLPYALQLAYGWTRLAFLLNLAFAIAIVPALLLAVSRYGAIGAAWVWTAVNLIYVAIGVWATHRRLFRSSGWYWFADVATVLAVALVTVGLWRTIFSPSLSVSTTIVVVIGAGLSGVAAAGAALPNIRRSIAMPLVS
jgi:O-antigen/teichoic acid export membrane protein